MDKEVGGERRRMGVRYIMCPSHLRVSFGGQATGALKIGQYMGANAAGKVFAGGSARILNEMISARAMVRWGGRGGGQSNP